MVITNLTSGLTQEASVTYGKPYEDYHLFFKPRDDITDGPTLLGIWQASHANLIQCPLQSCVELTKPFTMAEVVVPKFFPH
jgi:hypothetical protein